MSVTLPNGGSSDGNKSRIAEADEANDPESEDSVRSFAKSLATFTDTKPGRVTPSS